MPDSLRMPRNAARNDLLQSSPYIHVPFLHTKTSNQVPVPTCLMVDSATSYEESESRGGEGERSGLVGSGDEAGCDEGGNPGVRGEGVMLPWGWGG